MSTAAPQSAAVNRHRELQHVPGEWARLLLSAAARGAPAGQTASLLRAVPEDEVLPHKRAEGRALCRAAARLLHTGLAGQVGRRPMRTREAIGPVSR